MEMPYRDLTFSLSASAGDGARFRLMRRGRAVTASLPALSGTPAHVAGNVAVIHRAAAIGGKRPLWPRTVFSAWTPGDACEGQTAVRSSMAEWMAAPVYPVLLEYSGGFCALAATCGEKGDIAVACSGSPAATLSLDLGVESALPAGVASSLTGAARSLRVSLARGIAGRGSSPGSMAALEFVAAEAGKCIGGRGEMQDSYIWSFDLGSDGYAVAGFSDAGSTFTIQFPFLGNGRTYSAEWVDDRLDYYVKGGLEIRPGTVSRQTKAVVRTLPGGGFLCRLCESRNTAPERRG